MRKTGKNNFFTEASQLRWEFLRLNKKYRQNFDVYQDEDDNYFDYHKEATRDEFDKWQIEQANKFSEKWFIDYPHDYRSDKPPAWTNDFSPAIRCRGYNKGRFCILGDEVLYSKKKRMYVRLPAVIGIKINLSFHHRRIDYAVKRAWKEALKERQLLKRKYGLIKTETRTRLYDYWRFLDTYKKYQRLKDYKKVAEKIYGKDPSTIGSNTRKVAQNYKRSLHFINGGYVDIT